MSVEDSIFFLFVVLLTITLTHQYLVYHLHLKISGRCIFDIRAILICFLHPLFFFFFFFFFFTKVNLGNPNWAALFVIVVLRALGINGLWHVFSQANDCFAKNCKLQSAGHDYFVKIFPRITARFSKIF